MGLGGERVEKPFACYATERDMRKALEQNLQRLCDRFEIQNAVLGRGHDAET